MSRVTCISTFVFVFLFSCTLSLAAPYGDMTCDGTNNVVDVQISILMALGASLDPVIDADQNGVHDACDAWPELSCGQGTVLAGTTCVMDLEFLEGLTVNAYQDGYDTGYADASVGDTTYAQGYDDGLGICMELGGMLGGCTNYADIQALGSQTASSMDAIQDGCFESCLFVADKLECLAECISIQTGLSFLCGACYGEEVLCEIEICLTSCVDPTSEECAACAAVAGCPNLPEWCGGLPVPTGPEPTGACESPSDTELLNNTEFYTVVDECISQCFFEEDQGTCIALCVTQGGLSPECALCESAYDVCALDNCLTECINGIGSEDCVLCAEDAGCGPAWGLCAYAKVTGDNCDAPLAEVTLFSADGTFSFNSVCAQGPVLVIYEMAWNDALPLYVPLYNSWATFYGACGMTIVLAIAQNTEGMPPTQSELQGYKEALGLDESIIVVADPDYEINDAADLAMVSWFPTAHLFKPSLHFFASGSGPAEEFFNGILDDDCKIIEPPPAIATCYDLYNCIAECVGDTGCVQVCVDNADETTQALYASWNACALSYGGEDIVNSVYEFTFYSYFVCASNLALCVGEEGMPPQGDCETATNCAYDCGDDADCLAACFNNVSYDAASGISEVYVCAYFICTEDGMGGLLGSLFSSTTECIAAMASEAINFGQCPCPDEPPPASPTDYSGTWYLTADPDIQDVCGGVSAAYPPQAMELTIEEDGIAYMTMDIQGCVQGECGVIVPFTGYYDALESQLVLNGQWEQCNPPLGCTGFNDTFVGSFTSPTELNGTNTSNFLLEGSPCTVVWNLTGTKL